VAWASGPGIVLTTQPKVVSVLNDLAADPRNIIYVMSGETCSVTSHQVCFNCRLWRNSLDKVRMSVLLLRMEDSLKHPVKRSGSLLLRIVTLHGKNMSKRSSLIIKNVPLAQRYSSQFTTLIPDRRERDLPYIPLRRRRSQRCRTVYPLQS
jgi:hypothetical protein